MRFARGFDTSPLLAALAMIALLALAGCGGSSSKSKTTATTPPPPATTKPLDLAQRDSLTQATQKFVSAAVLFQSKINGCASNKTPAACVRKAARPAEKVARNTRRTITTLHSKTDGPCASGLTTVSDQLTSVTEDLGSLTQSTQKGDFKVATRLGTNVQSGLRSFAGQSTLAQQACTG
jgi:hypothetical protein